ncbi:Hcp1 family type VI secretion system effector [Azoarcus sp. TTM-91]|nr:Hcp1 family type VI secretion system effector [Azoarcus sp. TTM-91]
MESDMFLKIEGARMGPIKGEAQDQLHRDEIDIHSWSWGMQGNASATATAGSRTGGSSQVSVSELTISKGCDRASTSLLAALRSNEQIKRAILTVRKAGGTNPVEYLVITMENARIRSVEMSGTGGIGDQVSERVSISFQKIAVEYRGQDGAGGGNAVSRFETEFSPA